MRCCNICMKYKKKKYIAHCTICLEGVGCHDCLQKWRKAGNNPHICIICKNMSKTMRNVPPKQWTHYNVLTNITVDLTTSISVMERVQHCLLTIYGIIIMLVILTWSLYGMFTFLSLTLAIIESIT